MSPFYLGLLIGIFIGANLGIVVLAFYLATRSEDEIQTSYHSH
jgi:hypothetical protein